MVRSRQRGTVSCYIKDVLLSVVRRACVSGFTVHVRSAWNTYELTDYFYNGTHGSQCTRHTLGARAEAVTPKLGVRKKQNSTLRSTPNKCLGCPRSFRSQAVLTASVSVRGDGSCY